MVGRGCQGNHFLDGVTSFWDGVGNVFGESGVGNFPGRSQILLGRGWGSFWGERDTLPARVGETLSGREG